MQEDVLVEAGTTAEVPVLNELGVCGKTVEQPAADSPPRPRTDDPSTVLETYEASEDEAIGQRKLQDLSADIVGIHLGSFYGKSSMRNFADIAYRVRSKDGEHADSLSIEICSLMRPVRPSCLCSSNKDLHAVSGNWRRMKLTDQHTSSHRQT